MCGEDIEIETGLSATPAINLMLMMNWRPIFEEFSKTGNMATDESLEKEQKNWLFWELMFSLT